MLRIADNLGTDETAQKKIEIGNKLANLLRYNVYWRNVYIVVFMNNLFEIKDFNDSCEIDT